MKNNIRYILSFALIIFIFQACDQNDLDLRISPNDLGADEADPVLLLNAIQLAYADNQRAISDIGGQLTRIDYFFGRDYFNNLPGSVMDAIWRKTYSSGGTLIGRQSDVGILPNLQRIEDIDANTPADLPFLIAVGKTLYAHSLFQIVDYIGTAAFSEAGQFETFPSPNLDDGESVYNEAFKLLDEAEELFDLAKIQFEEDDKIAPGINDIFYGTDIDSWLKLVNTIRLRSYVLTDNKAAFDAIIAEGEYISSASDDLQLQYGTSELQPDNRHPDYAIDFKDDGAEIYQSNWLMSLMLENDDPRRRYYFYRQVPGTPGALDVNGVEVPPNEEELACSLVIPPAHYDGLVFCGADSGYWGRSHGNDEGTPPDGFRRTASGVYPVAGRFDDDTFDNVGLGKGGAGAGIEPIILSSYVDFWIGIMADSDAAKAAALRSGLEKSIAKVQSFGALDAGADLSFAPSADDVAAYIDGIEAAYLAASGDDKENIFAEQYFTTLYGGNTEAYNYYRLTGYPTTVLPNWEPNPGPFPRTLLLPQVEAVNNPNVSQRTDLTTQVFWDTNPPSPAFPPAN